MICRAWQAVYWPGLEANVKHHRERCSACDVVAPSQQQGFLLPTPPPDYSFQKVAVNMFQVDGKHYMIYVDRLTRWL